MEMDLSSMCLIWVPNVEASNSATEKQSRIEPVDKILALGKMWFRCKKLLDVGLMVAAMVGKKKLSGLC